MNHQQHHATFTVKASRYNKAQCLAAIEDCHATLRAQGAQIDKSYETKLWAEIDAMRERLARLGRSLDSEEREWQEFLAQQDDAYEERVCASYRSRGQSNLY